MTKHTNPPRMICFGEILWDNLPTGRMAGGAPMNVAYHLNRLGAESQMISRIGNDQPGKDLLNFSTTIGLPIALLQTDPVHATGEVIAQVMANHEVVYDILLDAAWDYIEFSPTLQSLAASADAFVFGSLSARNTASRETLLQLLDAAKFKVLDINLRAPHYDKEILALLLSKADLLKLNNDELTLLTSWFYQDGAPEAESIRFLQQEFNLQAVMVTKGSDGASYYTATEVYSGQAYPVEVADTIGAGDSFLAAFLYKKLTGADIKATLDYALAMGAFVAGKPGGCPVYDKTELEQFIIKHHS
jgi:fructokinase